MQFDSLDEEATWQCFIIVYTSSVKKNRMHLSLLNACVKPITLHVVVWKYPYRKCVYQSTVVCNMSFDKERPLFCVYYK